MAIGGLLKRAIGGATSNAITNLTRAGRFEDAAVVERLASKRNARNVKVGAPRVGTSGFDFQVTGMGGGRGFLPAPPPPGFGPGPPSGSGFEVGGVDLGAGFDAVGGCNLLPEPGASICRATRAALGGGKPEKSAQELVPQQVPSCPPGTFRLPGTQTCVSPGDAFPGGAPMTFGAGGAAVVGAFGLPAIAPSIVGSVANSRGEVVPIRRCPRGMVLGKDELCYPKQVLPRRSSWRKHKGERRPPMTGADAAALRRIGTLQTRVKGLAKDAGLACKKR